MHNHKHVPIRVLMTRLVKEIKIAVQHSIQKWLQQFFIFVMEVITLRMKWTNLWGEKFEFFIRIWPSFSSRFCVFLQSSSSSPTDRFIHIWPTQSFRFPRRIPFLFHRPCRLIKVSSSSSSSTTAKENDFFPPTSVNPQKRVNKIYRRYITKESLFYVWLYVNLIPLWGSCVHSIRFNRFIIDFSFKNNVSPLQLLCL